LLKEIPTTKISKERLRPGIPLVDILIETKIAKSKRAARDLVSQGGAYVNNQAWREGEAKITLEHSLSGKAILLRSGKKNYHLLIIEE
ncbi:MAG: tyrosine--tRNA ligase, partial [bacterium]